MDNHFKTRKFLQESRTKAIGQAYKSALLQERNGWNTIVRDTNWGAVIISKLNLSWKVWLLLMGTMAVYIILIYKHG